MNSNQANKWYMLLKVQSFFKTFNSTFSAFPQFPPLITQIGNLIESIPKESVDVSADLSGFTQQKEDDRLALEKVCGKVGSALLAYGIANGTPYIIESEDYLPSSLTLSSDSELYVLAVQLFGVAQPVEAALVTFGSGPADVAELNTGAGKFLPQIKVGRNQRKVKSRAAQKVKELFAEADEALAKLDTYMKVYQYNDANMYDQYNTARKIDKRAGGHNVHKKHGKVLPGFVAHAPFAAEVLKATSKLILSNRKRGGDIIFYFSQRANEKPVAQTKLTTVSFSKPLKITANDAGYTVHTPHLNILNPNVTHGLWKAEIETK